MLCRSLLSIILISVLALATFYVPLACSEVINKQSIYDLISRNTLCVRFRNTTGDGWCTGSGVILRNRFVLTAGHVANTAQHMDCKVDPQTGQQICKISYDNGQLIRERFLNGNNTGKTIIYCRVIRFSPFKTGYDLCLLESAEPLSSDDIKFDESIPRLGQKIITCGSPLSHNNVLSEGIFSRQGVKFCMDNEGDVNEDPINADSKFFDLASIPCAPGNSGGGIFSLDTGNLLGEISHTAAEGSNQFYYVPTRFIRKYTIEAGIEFIFGGPIPENLFSKPIMIEPFDLPKTKISKEETNEVPMELLRPILKDILKSPQPEKKPEQKKAPEKK